MRYWSNWLLIMVPRTGPIFRKNLMMHLLKSFRMRRMKIAIKSHSLPEMENNAEKDGWQPLIHQLRKVSGPWLKIRSSWSSGSSLATSGERLPISLREEPSLRSRTGSSWFWGGSTFSKPKLTPKNLGPRLFRKFSRVSNNPFWATTTHRIQNCRVQTEMLRRRIQRTPMVVETVANNGLRSRLTMTILWIDLTKLISNREVARAKKLAKEAITLKMISTKMTRWIENNSEQIFYCLNYNKKRDVRTTHPHNINFSTLKQVNIMPIYYIGFVDQFAIKFAK